MYPVWLLCLSSLRRKKVQNGMIAIIIMLSTLLLSTAVLVMNNTDEVFSNMHNEVNGSHQILYFEDGLYNPYPIYRWWQEQEGVNSSELIEYRSLSWFTHQDKEVSNIGLYMMNTPLVPSSVDKLNFAHGMKSNTPGEGTVWIPTSLAYSKNISIGDPMGFKTETGILYLKVSAIVVDIFFSQPFTITSRIWMNSTDYNQYIANMQGTDKFMMSLRYDNVNNQNLYWNQFEHALGSPFLETSQDFESISSFYLIINQLISFIMIFLAVVMILAALYTIGYTISDAILSNVKTIGIIKSIGISSDHLVRVYVIQYALLSVLSVIPGILFSFYFSKIIIRMSLSYLETRDSLLNINFSKDAFFIGILVISIVTLVSLLFALKAKSIQPAQAMRYGMTEKENMKRSKRLNASRNRMIGFDILPVTFVTGTRRILQNIRGSLLMIIITALTTSVLVFGCVFIFSIASIHKTIPLWGYDNSDINVEILDTSVVSVSALKQDLLNDNRIKDVNNIGNLYGVISETENKNNTSEMNTGIYIMTTDGKFDDIGFVNILGENPKGNHEISIGVNVSKKLNKSVGDTIDVYIQNIKGTYTISGVYQAIANMSNSARMTSDAVNKLNLKGEIENPLFLFNVLQGVSPDLMVNELIEKYGDDIFIATQETLINETFSQAVSILILPMSIMGLLFLIVAFIITYNISSMNIKKESKVYGIYKSIGMTSRQIRFSITTGSLFLAGTGVIIGIPIGLYILPILLNIILTDYGIVEMPLIIEWYRIVTVVPFAVISVGLGAWFASKLIRKTSPKILIVE
ncbi:ABC transporter permease [Chengkuizengella sediminis]|uniref:ABC transporter permease n=1 Tax=Chengkuizengella sediminis TaxID=1885917 RepID=UPI00138992F8|nr:FtsX-like permease family protein [Chengkuizengella sediminis]NDI35234.1 FtsX-like permease family protein [Chengkuizengella sediminis]